MKFTPTKLSGAYIVEIEPHIDERGWFARTYCQEEFSRYGYPKAWVQLNHSVTKQRGTIRGMHFQYPPFSEVKLVKCVVGKVFDVIIDIRQNSPTFLEWAGIELSAENRKMFLVPEGFAHGFQTLTDNIELIYHHSAIYEIGHEGGIRYDDPKIGIEWPLNVTQLSEKDKNYPYISPVFNGIE